MQWDRTIGRYLVQADTRARERRFKDAFAAIDRALALVVGPKQETPWLEYERIKEVKTSLTLQVDRMTVGATRALNETTLQGLSTQEKVTHQIITAFHSAFIMFSKHFLYTGDNELEDSYFLSLLQRYGKAVEGLYKDAEVL